MSKPTRTWTGRAVALAAALAALAACETAKGVGRDVEKAGEAIQRAIN